MKIVPNQVHAWIEGKHVDGAQVVITTEGNASGRGPLRSCRVSLTASLSAFEQAMMDESLATSSEKPIRLVIVAADGKYATALQAQAYTVAVENAGSGNAETVTLDFELIEEWSADVLRHSAKELRAQLDSANALAERLREEVNRSSAMARAMRLRAAYWKEIARMKRVDA